jgi:GNAT superfamily N-acetyltransferase
MQQEQQRWMTRLGEPVGRFHAWWRGDPPPALPALSDLSIFPSDDVRTVAQLLVIDAREIEERLSRGHRLWLARIGGGVAGWGWSAAEELSIGELRISRPIPPGNRYLWDFFTAPPWRGRGIYPRLLQTIVSRDADADRFWLGHDLDNAASARGVAKSGFREAGVLYRRQNERFVLVPSEPLDRAVAAASLFGVAIADPCSVRVA